MTTEFDNALILITDYKISNPKKDFNPLVFRKAGTQTKLGPAQLI